MKNKILWKAIHIAILKGSLLSFLITVISGVIIQMIKNLIPNSVIENMSSHTMPIQKISFAILPWFAFQEELIFRVVPITIFMILFFGTITLYERVHNTLLDARIKHLGIIGLVITCIISSIIFGYIHGNIMNVFIQGIAGVIYFIVWIYCFMITMNLKNNLLLAIIIATYASTMAHAADNAYILSVYKITTIHN